MAWPLMLRRALFAAELAALDDAISSSSKLVSLDRLLGVTADGILLVQLSKSELQPGFHETD